jgi:murein tripeptide amidase MpaA
VPPPYKSVANLHAELTRLDAAYTTCTVTDLPEQTQGGKPMKLARMTAGGEGRAVLFVAGLHAREVAQPDAVISFMEKMLVAYDTDAGFTAGNYTLSAQQVKDILEKVDTYLIPEANPDGRDHVLAGNPMWRKNWDGAGGVDNNRNFDILWDHLRTFMPNAVDTSNAPADNTYRGPSAASERETRNIAWAMYHKGIRYYADLHSAIPAILHPWGLDINQSNDAGQSFVNRLKDGQRDGNAAHAYSEYIQAAALADHRTIAGLVWRAVKLARGRDYPIAQACDPQLQLESTTGASDDYAYSRNPDERRAFCIEFGSWSDPAERFSPNAAAYPRIEDEIHAALAAFLLHVSTLPFANPPPLGAPPPSPPAAVAPPPGGGAPPGGAPPPGGAAPPPSNPFIRIWRWLRNLFNWLFRLLLLRPAPIVLPPPAPAPSASTTPSTPVHSLRLSTDRATGGQTVQGRLLDNSLDFTQINRSLFMLVLQVPPAPGATGALYWRVPVVRFLGPRDLEFVVPPVGTGSAMKVPPGTYIVLCRYGFWTVEGDRLLSVR